MLATHPKLIALVTAIAVAAPVSAAQAASGRHMTRPVARATAQAPAHNIPYRHYRHWSRFGQAKPSGSPTKVGRYHGSW